MKSLILLLMITLCLAANAFTQSSLELLRKISNNYTLDRPAANNFDLPCPEGLTLMYWGNYQLLLIRAFDPDNGRPDYSNPVIYPKRNDILIKTKLGPRYLNEKLTMVETTIIANSIAEKTYKKLDLVSDYRFSKITQLDYNDSQKTMELYESESELILRQCIYRRLYD